jgi:hypothetical protein
MTEQLTFSSENLPSKAYIGRLSLGKSQKSKCGQPDYKNPTLRQLARMIGAEKQGKASIVREAIDLPSEIGHLEVKVGRIQNAMNFHMGHSPSLCDESLLPCLEVCYYADVNGNAPA